MSLPQLPLDALVVPIPTIPGHKRVRGYAHVELVARLFAQRRGLAYAEVLKRRHNGVQRGLNRSQRIAQAKEAYVADTVEHHTCLLIDDVYTTGATLEYASRALRAAGGQEVWVVAMSRQPLEK